MDGDQLLCPRVQNMRQECFVSVKWNMSDVTLHVVHIQCGEAGELSWTLGSMMIMWSSGFLLLIQTTAVLCCCTESVVIDCSELILLACGNSSDENSWSDSVFKVNAVNTSWEKDNRKLVCSLPVALQSYRRENRVQPWEHLADKNGFYNLSFFISENWVLPWQLHNKLFL